MKNNKVVYIHKRGDNNEIFYVGIGNPSRPYRKSSRTQYWHNIVNKAGYSIEILAYNLTKELACVIEKSLIKEYGRRDLNTGHLVNMTEGGDITIISQKTKDKISKTLMGHKVSNETKNLMSKNYKYHNSMLGYKHSEEFKEKKRQQSKGNKNILGKKHSDITKAKLGKEVIDTVTNIVYPTAKIAALNLNLNYKNLSRYLSGSRKNKTNLIYKI